MAGNYPIYDPGCVVDESLQVEKAVDPCSGVELEWEGYPEHCDTIPQGYHIYRTTTPPTSSSVSLCIGIDDEKILRDRSIWNNSVTHYSGGTATTPTYTSLTPRGKQSNKNAITLRRAQQEFLYTPADNVFDFEYMDYTIEMWVNHGDKTIPGNRPTYAFPCETIAACYDASTGKANWRLFFEPIHAWWSHTTGLSGDAPAGSTAKSPGGYLQQESHDGALMLEVNENGDSTGGSILHTVMMTYTNTNSIYSFSNNGLRSGYSHISIVRDSTNISVYVDGALRASIPVTFEMQKSGQQAITFGRHYGESGHLDPMQFSQSYGLSASVPFTHGSDGNASHLNGTIYDVRIVKGIALPPPTGGQVDGVCHENAWHQSFKKIASLPHTTKRWSDPDPPIDKGAYYRVTAVQCGKDVSCICPNYVVCLKESAQKINAIAVNTQTELTDALNSEPPTMLDVFNTWDRSSPYNNVFYPGGSGAAGDHGAWYFNTSINSFVNPNNTTQPVHITAPEGQWMKKYKHEAIVQSDDRDDDLLGLVAAYTYINGVPYSINFVRTQGGFSYGGNWACVLMGPGTNRVLKTKTIGGSSPNSSGGNGWSGKTAIIKIERDGNSLKAWTGSHRGSGYQTRDSHVVDPASEMSINFALDPPPPGIANWLPFQGATGYGFMAWSQGDAFYRDWYLHPNPNKRIFDFTNGAPGRVFDWDMLRGKWILAPATAWEVVNKLAAEVYFPETGKTYNFNCAGKLTVS